MQVWAEQVWAEQAWAEQVWAEQVWTAQVYSWTGYHGTEQGCPQTLALGRAVTSDRDRREVTPLPFRLLSKDHSSLKMQSKVTLVI